MKLNEIKPNPDNPRILRDGKFAKLKQSLQDFPEMMDLRPIVVDENGIILGGNMRFRALQELYGKSGEIPDTWVKRADELTDEQKKEFIIKDNVAFGDWDFEALKGWDEPLDDWGVEIPEDFDDETEHTEVVEDDFDEGEVKENICQSGDIWQLGEHRLMCGDSTNGNDVAVLMDGAKADMVLTDPPYNVAIENSQGMTIQNDDMSEEEFFNFLSSSFYCLNFALRDGGAFYIWFASREHLNFENALNKNNLKVRQELIWNKNAMIMGRQDYQWKHEPCLYGWKEGAAHYFIDDRKQVTVIEDKKPDFKKMKKEEMQKLLEEIYSDKVSTTILNENKPTSNDLHPTMKPLKLLARQIKNSSKINEIIFDLFGGSGSTLIACEQLNRKCYMMELDPHYCDVIIARWEKLTNKKAVKL